MSDKYPSYVPITDEELWALFCSNTHLIESLRAIEQAVLARLPKPSGEPVAWKYAHNTFTFTNSKATADECPEDWIPLYTHPAPDTAERDALVELLAQAEWLLSGRPASTDAKPSVIRRIQEAVGKHGGRGIVIVGQGGDA